MEDSFDFQIDFESISSMPIPVILETEPSQRTYTESMHNEKKIYTCTAPDCGKIFKFKSEIKRHIIIHKNDRPYSCPVSGCMKSFKRADTLDNHIRLHDGSLPYVCDKPGCGKKFVSRSALSYHASRHVNNDGVFKCSSEDCGKSFSTASQLKQHQNTCSFHHEESPIEIIKPVEADPYKLHKKENNDMLLEAAMKANESIQWEVKSQQYEDTSDSPSKKEKLEIIFSYIIQENKILKDQLKQGQKLNKLSEEEKQSPSDLENQTSSLGFTIPSDFFGDGELNFLEVMQNEGSEHF